MTCVQIKISEALLQLLGRTWSSPNLTYDILRVVPFPQGVLPSSTFPDSREVGYLFKASLCEMFVCIPVCLQSWTVKRDFRFFSVICSDSGHNCCLAWNGGWANVCLIKQWVNEWDVSYAQYRGRICSGLYLRICSPLCCRNSLGFGLLESDRKLKKPGSGQGLRTKSSFCFWKF